MVGNRAYPGIVGDFGKSFDRLGAMHPDVVLPFHPETVDLMRRVAQGHLVDRHVLPTMVRDARAAFAVELAKQRQGT